MFDSWLRALKDRLLSPWLRHVSPAVHPNAVSLLAFALGVGAAASAWAQRYGLALVLWLASRLIDGVDGTLALVQGTQSDFGGYLDIVLDFIVYALIPIGIVWGHATADALRAASLLLAAFYVNAASWMYLAAILERRATGAASNSRTTVTMPSGLIAGAETIVFYALFLIFPTRVVLLFTVMAVLVALTVVQRLVWAVRNIG